jgi:hypothetical protein
MEPVYQPILMFMLMLCFNAELVFKIESKQDGAFIPLPKKEKVVGRALGEDSYYTTPISLTVGDGVGGCKFSSSFISRYVTRHAAVRTLEQRIKPKEKEGPDVSNLRYFSDDLKKDLISGVNEYAKTMNQIFNNEEPKNLPKEAKKVVNDKAIHTSTTLVTASIHYDSDNDRHILHTFQKGDSLAVVFRKMLSTADNQTKADTYHYLPVFVTNAQQAGGFNAPDQFSDGLKHYNDSKDESLFFHIYKHDLVFLGSDGVFDNISIGFLTFAVNLYIKAKTSAGMFQTKMTDVLDHAFKFYADALKSGKEDIDKYMNKEIKAFKERENKKQKTALETRKSLAGSLIEPKQYANTMEAHKQSVPEKPKSEKKETQAISNEGVNSDTLTAEIDKPDQIKQKEAKPDQPIIPEKIVLKDNGLDSQEPVFNAQEVKVPISGNKGQSNEQPSHKQSGGLVRDSQKISPVIHPLASLPSLMLKVPEEKLVNRDSNALIITVKQETVEIKDTVKSEPKPPITQNYIQVDQPTQKPSQTIQEKTKSNLFENPNQRKGEYDTERFHTRNVHQGQKLGEFQSTETHSSRRNEVIQRLNKLRDSIMQEYENVKGHPLPEIDGYTPKTIAPRSSSSKKYIYDLDTQIDLNSWPLNYGNDKRGKKAHSYISDIQADIVKKQLAKKLELGPKNHRDNSFNLFSSPTSGIDYSPNTQPKLNNYINGQQIPSSNTNANNQKETPKNTIKKSTGWAHHEMDDNDRFRKYYSELERNLVSPYSNGRSQLGSEMIRKKSERILAGSKKKIDYEEEEQFKIDLNKISKLSFFKTKALNLIKEPSDTFNEKLIEDDVAKAIGTDFSFTETEIENFEAKFDVKEFTERIASLVQRITTVKHYYPSPFYMQADVMLSMRGGFPPIPKEDDITVAAGLVIERDLKKDELEGYVVAMNADVAQWTSDSTNAVKFFKNILAKPFLGVKQIPAMPQQKEKTKTLT